MKESAFFSSSAAAADGSLPDSILFRKGQYKFWAISAIFLLALWSIFTGTVNLKWSANSLNQILDDHEVPYRDDLDVLELEERKKVVWHMWDVYAHGKQTQLPRFWHDAFEAAYEEMVSEDREERDAVVSEIAKMSMSIVDFDLPAPPRFKKKSEKNFDGIRDPVTKSSMGRR